MEKFRHIPPSGKEERLKSLHQIELNAEDKKLGSATYEYWTSPFPLYYIENLQINRHERGKGYGTEIMDHLEKILKERSKAGILVDGIDAGTPAMGMYERRGWIPVPGTAYLAFNLPKGSSVEQLIDFDARYANEVRENRLVNSFHAKLEKEGE